MSFNSPSHGKSPVVGTTRAWEDLRREARRLEGELDVKLAAYNKLCSGFEASYAKSKGDGLVSAEQLSQDKASEIEALLGRLSDTNEEMGFLLGGTRDSRAHLHARHRDILTDYTQEFRRLNSSLSAARDRVALLAGAGDGSGGSSHVSVNMGSSTQGLLRERAAVTSSTSAIDEVLSTAQAVSSNLMQQRQLFDSIGDRLLSVGARFPVVNSVLNAIRRKKSKDTIVLSAVITGCVLFTIVYIMFVR
ncbi:hypothetical protein FOA52_003905 [Chlamydomonas sp. UWO 241]|nr:hypothetical protein FOA52_003905 [Chlamydomonas sp. UWO 241]